MILLCTIGSSSILFIGIHLIYFQGFSICIPCFFPGSIAQQVKASKLLPFLGVLVILYLLPFPRLANSVQLVFCKIFFLKKKAPRLKGKKKKGPQAQRTEALILQTTPSPRKE